MVILNVLVCITAIFWISIGIRIHSNWIQLVFINESNKIQNQSELIREFGYGSLNTPNKLASRNGLVFAYWDEPAESQEHTEVRECLSSPLIFQLVNLNLIAGTSILLLIILSKGLFSAIGLV